MKTILLIASMKCACGAFAQSTPVITSGGSTFVTDTSATFIANVYPNDTVYATLWLELITPVADTVGPFVVPSTQNYQWNPAYHYLLCGTTQTFRFKIQNTVGVAYSAIDSVNTMPCSVGVEEIEHTGLAAIMLAPMPVISVSTFFCSQKKGTIVIYDMLGKIVITIPIENGTTLIDRSDFVTGLYTCIEYDVHGVQIGYSKIIIE